VPNIIFAKAGGSSFYESEVLNSSFVHLMKFSAENPRLRKYEKRYASPYHNRSKKLKMKNDNVRKFLQSFNILTDIEIDDFLQLLSYKIFKKADYYIKEGETCKQIAFVLTGSLRSYYISDKDEQITYCITFPNSLMTAYSSFLTAQPTMENIQAITKTELLIIPKDKFEKLVQQNPNWVYFLKTIAEQQYIELEKRIFQLQKSDASKRYTDLMKNQPEYVQKIPLQYLASYLGISQRHLSRIRKEFSF
jgi:CRP-like cAMP-binding protein